MRFRRRERGAEARRGRARRGRAWRGRGAGVAVGLALLVGAPLVGGLPVGAPLVGVASEAHAQSPPRAPAETVVAELGDRSLELSAVRNRGYAAVNAAELLGDFFTEVSLDGTAARARLAGKTLLLWAESPFFRFGDRVYQLSNPPYRERGAFWVPAELVTHWWPRTAPDAGARLAATGAEGAGAEVPTANRRPGPWRIVIDAGHGGKDPGTRGRAGTREKDVVLDIALRVARLLEARDGFEPILTRDRDAFVELRERSRFAVRREGDLFLSIHANWAPSRGARGFETYFLGEARSEEARRAAMRENAALQFEANGARAQQEIQDIEFILAGLDRSQWVRQSSRLGGFIQNSLRRTQQGADRGVKPGPYWVLVGASGSMPAVLVEVGFLSHPEEERVLASGSGRQRIAASIADAVEEYFRDYARRVGVTASGE